MKPKVTILDSGNFLIDNNPHDKQIIYTHCVLCCMPKQHEDVAGRNKSLCERCSDVVTLGHTMIDQQSNGNIIKAVMNKYDFSKIKEQK